MSPVECVEVVFTQFLLPDECMPPPDTDKGATAHTMVEGENVVHAESDAETMMAKRKEAVGGGWKSES